MIAKYAIVGMYFLGVANGISYTKYVSASKMENEAEKKKRGTYLAIGLALAVGLGYLYYFKK